MTCVVSAIVGLVVGMVIMYFLRKRRFQNNHGKLNFYQVTHTFASSKKLEELKAYNETNAKRVAKLCHTHSTDLKFTYYSVGSLKQYCYWAAESPDAILEVIGQIGNFWSSTTIDEVESIQFP